MKTFLLRTFIAVASCALLASCNKEEVSDNVGNDGSDVEIIAKVPVWGVEGTTVEDLDTKTIRNEDGSTFWSFGNTINVFQGSLSGGTFYTDIPEPSPVAVFRGTLDTVTGTSQTDAADQDFWAVYPYSPDNICDGTSVTLSVKDNGMGVAGTFADNDFPSVGTSKNLSIAFYNVCSGLALKVTEKGIRTVTVKGNKSEPLAGTVRVTFSEGLPVVAEVMSAKDSVVLRAPEADGFIPGETYYIPLLPGTLSAGFELKFTKHSVSDSGNTDILQGVYSTSEPVTLKRSVFGTVYDLDADVDFLKIGEIELDAVETIEEVYQEFIANIASANGVAIYTPMKVAFNFCGDDLYSAGVDWNDIIYLGELNEFYYSTESEPLKMTYKKCYQFIDVANKFMLKYKAGLPEGDGSDELKKSVAETRVLRAYVHMMLSIGWGNVPLVDRVFATGTYPVQMTQEKVLDWCVEECESALAYLDSRNGTSDKEGAFKVTKGFANAVAGKASLFAGDYESAREYLQDVVESGNYALVPGYRYMENFHIEGNGNEEKIFECNIEPYVNASFSEWVKYTTWMEANLFNWRGDMFAADICGPYSGIMGWGAIGIPQWVADEFVAYDGTDSFRLNATMIDIDELVFGTEYFDEHLNMMTPEERRNSSSFGIRSQSGLYGQSFYLPLKIIPKRTDFLVSSYRFNNHVIMRYAEVLLMYAEACLQTGDSESARTVINQLQQRAGSKTLSQIVDMDVIKMEKKIEMWMEGCRWPDMVRWGDFDGLRDAGRRVTVLYDSMFASPSSAARNLVWHEYGRFFTEETSRALDNGKDVGFVDGKHNYFPFSIEELEENPNLVQNPGW